MSEILVVDDDPRICRNLSEILRDDGHNVEAVTSGNEALKLIEKDGFDVALIDLVMPELSGMELLAEIRRKRPNTRVIMITAFATVENAVEAMKRGATDYVAKPFKMNEIQVVVNMALEDASFKERISSAEGSVDIENVISSLNNAIRRGVIIHLNKGRYSFTEIMKAIGVDDPTKLNFHLRKLRSSKVLKQDDKKRYFLTPIGKKALNVLKSLDMDRIEWK